MINRAQFQGGFSRNLNAARGTRETFFPLELTRENIRAIAGNLLKNVAARMEQMEITLTWEDSAVEILADQGFDPVYGARPLRRVIQAAVEDAAAEKLLDDMTAALELRTDAPAAQAFEVIANGTKQTYYIHKPTSNLTVGSVQQFLDCWLKENGGKIDYIHGADVVEKLAAEPDSLGILLPDMQKAELFPTVIKDGALPRKTFSMGHAADKRFYMECRNNW